MSSRRDPSSGVRPIDATPWRTTVRWWIAALVVAVLLDRATNKANNVMTAITEISRGAQCRPMSSTAKDRLSTVPHPAVTFSNGALRVAWNRSCSGAFGVLSGRSRGAVATVHGLLALAAVSAFAVRLRQLGSRRTVGKLAALLVACGVAVNAGWRLRAGMAPLYLQVNYESLTSPPFALSDAAIVVGLVLLVVEEIVALAVRAARPSFVGA